jgi:hypothetical protein
MSSPELQVLFAGFDRAQKRVRERRALYYVVIDGLALAKLPTPVERKMLTDWMSEPARSELECQYSLGSAVAMSSRPVRAVLTALNWIRRPPKPQVVVETVVEAIDVGLERLRDASVSVTPAMQMLRAQEHVRSQATRR